MATDDRTVGVGDVVARAHARLLADHSLQFHFTPLNIPPTPPWFAAFIKMLQAVGRFLGALGPVVQISFWAVVAAVVLGAVFLIARAAIRFWKRRGSRRRKPARATAQPLDLRPSAQRAAALLEEADRLAAAQRFEEAAHALLFRTIADLETRRPRALRPALTSRDIAALAEIPAPARGAFATIAERVELSFFGGRSLGAGDFSVCRTAYLAFASPQSWAVGAQP
jgi:hypothetical protein